MSEVKQISKVDGSKRKEGADTRQREIEPHFANVDATDLRYWQLACSWAKMAGKTWNRHTELRKRDAANTPARMWEEAEGNDMCRFRGQKGT